MAKGSCIRYFPTQIAMMNSVLGIDCIDASEIPACRYLPRFWLAPCFGRSDAARYFAKRIHHLSFQETKSNFLNVHINPKKNPQVLLVGG